MRGPAFSLRFLLALGVPEHDANQDAEGIEHHTGPATLACMECFVASLDRRMEEQESP